jgi:septal ring factor EnvC (AmiA/AmiB activator)
MDKIKVAVNMLRGLVDPTTASSRSSEQQLQDRSSLEINVKQFYLAQENMAKIRTQYEELTVKLRAAEKSFQEELQQVEEQIAAEKAAEEAAEFEEEGDEAGDGSGEEEEDDTGEDEEEDGGSDRESSYSK